MRIMIVFGTDGCDVRTAKTCRSLVRLGHEVHFVGWDRRPDQTTHRSPDTGTAHVIASRTKLGKSNWIGQLRFSWHVMRQLLRLRPDVVCAVNEDNALRVIPFRGWLYRHLVCDLYDSFADRFSNRAAIIKHPMRWLCRFAHRRAHRLIVTDAVRAERLTKHAGKTTIVENVPEDPGEEWARTPLSGPIKIFVSGSLHRHRGLEQILAAAEETSGVSIVAAGWVSDDCAEDIFTKSPLVEFHGLLSSQQSLEVAAQCDAILAYYAPVSQNHIYASPNKIFDALSVGRPVIINREAKVSGWVSERQLGYSCPYDDIDGLKDIIAELERRRPTAAEFAQRARQLFLDRHCWTEMEQRLNVLYAGLQGQTVKRPAGDTDSRKAA